VNIGLNMVNIKIIFVFCFSVLLYGCSSKFVYNNLDWIIEWYVDDYVQLSAQQNLLVEKRLDVLHQWHREEELIKYRDQLEQIATDLDNLPVDIGQLDAHLQQIFVHWQTMRKQVSYELATLAPTLNSKQVNYLFTQLEDRNKKQLDEFEELGIKAYNKKRQKNIEQSLDEYLGSVTELQKYSVSYFVKNANVLQAPHIAFTRTYQQQLKNTFAQKDPQKLTDILLLLLNNSESFRTPEYNEKLSENRQLALNLLHNISETLTSQQIEHLQHKINDFIKLIDQLIAG
jgi:hypothetical protein